MWDKKDEWWKKGNGHLVVVKRHSIQPSNYINDISDGLNRWAVYAYIYPDHPMFSQFDKNGPMYQEAANLLPLHGGPSYFEAHEHDGKVTSYQIGADYNHLHDNRFTHIDTPEDVGGIGHFEVFIDAENLFEFLQNFKQ